LSVALIPKQIRRLENRSFEEKEVISIRDKMGRRELLGIATIGALAVPAVLQGGIEHRPSREQVIEGCP
jgi:hypothetical protein